MVDDDDNLFDCLMMIMISDNDDDSDDGDGDDDLGDDDDDDADDLFDCLKMMMMLMIIEILIICVILDQACQRIFRRNQAEFFWCFLNLYEVFGCCMVVFSVVYQVWR